MKTPTFVSTANAAKKLGYTLQHTRLLIRQGRLNAIKIGRDWVIDPRLLAEFYARHKKKV